jgi:hypothetical protein
MALLKSSIGKDSMPAPGNLISDTKAQEGARVFMGNLIAALNLLVIGYPLVSRRWGRCRSDG